MTTATLFAAIGALAVTARKRRETEHREFLEFYKTLVENLPSEVCEIFGTLSGVSVRAPGCKDDSWGIELTATDYVWWKGKIEGERVHFVKGVASVKADMLHKISKQAEMTKLTPEERKSLLKLLEGEGE